MGGTSTDVSLIDGELPQRFEQLIGGVRLVQPMLDVHSIAAGGGSILTYRDGRFAVGPASAGADPGPACYGRGGPLTLTDVQVLLGHLRRDTLPALFGRDGTSAIDTGAVRRGFEALAAQMAAPPGPACAAENVAESFLEVGRRVDGECHPTGLDPPGPRCGGFHALLFRRCRRAACLPRGPRRRRAPHSRAPAGERALSVRHRRGGPARGAPREPRRELDAAGLAAARAALAELQVQARRNSPCTTAARQRCAVAHLLELRAGDSEVSLSVPLAALSEVRAHFHAEHLRRFGFAADALQRDHRGATGGGALRLGRCHAPAYARRRRESLLPARVRAWFGGWQRGAAGAAQ